MIHIYNSPPTTDTLDIYNTYLDSRFTQYLLNGWLQDTQTNTKPFRLNFVEKVINDLNFYFNIIHDTYSVGGFYLNLLDYSIFHINTGNSVDDRNAFVYVVLHELGHALGLGENLSDLFAYRFWVGSDEDLQNILLNAISYHPIFVGTLLERMKEVNREYEFWRAAFHSNEAFITLWNKKMYDLVDFNKLFYAKALDYYLFMDSAALEGAGINLEDFDTIDRDPLIKDALKISTGMNREELSITLINYWSVINTYGVAYTYKNEAKANFLSLIGIMYELAIENEFYIHFPVFEFILESHIHRYS